MPSIAANNCLSRRRSTFSSLTRPLFWACPRGLGRTRCRICALAKQEASHARPATDCCRDSRAYRRSVFRIEMRLKFLVLSERERDTTRPCECEGQGRQVIAFCLSCCAAWPPCDANGRQRVAARRRCGCVRLLCGPRPENRLIKGSIVGSWRRSSTSQRRRSDLQPSHDAEQRTWTSPPPGTGRGRAGQTSIGASAHRSCSGSLVSCRVVRVIWSRVVSSCLAIMVHSDPSHQKTQWQ